MKMTYNAGTVSKVSAATARLKTENVSGVSWGQAANPSTNRMSFNVTKI